MKRTQLSLYLIFTIMAFAALAPAQSNLYFGGGIQETKLLGTGNKDNEFTFGLGYVLEAGIHNPEDNFTWIIYGLAGSSHINRVKNSEREVSCFTPYYTEVRFSLRTDLYMFWFLGFDWNRMHFDRTEGADNQYFYSIGAGASIPIKKFFIQPKIKPYLVTSNSLGQSFGITFQLCIAFEEPLD
jgi:hypothetical protein